MMEETPYVMTVNSKKYGNAAIIVKSMEFIDEDDE